MPICFINLFSGYGSFQVTDHFFDSWLTMLIRVFDTAPFRIVQTPKE